MLVMETHHCPECDGAIAREFYAVDRVGGRETAHLYCDFCHVVWETDVYADHEVFALDYRARTEPDNFARALQRLEDARLA